MPIFSIIIPAYNAESYLGRCLQSIFSQDFTNYEVICIDDGSTDSTPEILRNNTACHDNLIVISQSNSGMATARNRGLEKAQGEYIMFVDSDDSLCSTALSTLASHLAGKDIIGFGTRILNEVTGDDTDNPVSVVTLMKGWDYFNMERLKPRPVHFVCIWQRIYRRAFLEENELRFAEGLRRGEDDLFTTFAMLHAKSVKTISDCLYTYYLRGNSITRTVDSKLEADSRCAQQILADSFIPMRGVDKSIIYQVIASNFITRLSAVDGSLSAAEWKQFRQVCITSRHRRLYRISSINPALLRLYYKLCSLHR